MGDFVHFSGIRTCADDIELAVDLHAVSIDDFAVMLPGPFHGQCRLATGRRSTKQDYLFILQNTGSLLLIDIVDIPTDPKILQAYSMTQVLTLISNVEDATITDEIRDKYADILNASHSNWLNENVALDIFFDADVTPDLSAMLKAENFDHAIQDPVTRRKSLLIADMDSTIIQCECIDELADFIGIKDKVSHITEAAMRGEIDFKGALKERVALLEGLKVDDLESVFNERVRLTPGATTLVRTMNAFGANTILVSGGFTYFTGRVAALAGFKVDRGNILLHADGKLTGKVREPIVDSDTKLNSLLEFQANAGLEKFETMAVGDGANDIAMIEGAGFGVGYRPFPATAEAADAAINYGDLTALLYIQGYSFSDFVDG